MRADGQSIALGMGRGRAFNKASLQDITYKYVFVLFILIKMLNVKRVQCIIFRVSYCIDKQLYDVCFFTFM